LSSHFCASNVDAHRHRSYTRDVWLMADGLLYPWVQAGNNAWLNGLKAKPELNGQGVKILSFDRRSERWLCKVKSSGEELKVKAQNLAEHEPAEAEVPNEEEEEEATKNVEWLRKGVHAVVHGQEEHQNQIVRVLLVGADGPCSCLIRVRGGAAAVAATCLAPTNPESRVAAVESKTATMASDVATVAARLMDTARERLTHGVLLRSARDLWPAVDGRQHQMQRHKSWATGEHITVDQGNLRPLAGSTPTNTQAATETAPTNGSKGSDWAAVELERRKLAEGFRAGFEEGATVVLQGLSSQELNGKSGQLVKWDSQSLRWQVKIEGMEENKALRPTNLVVQDPEGASRKRKHAE